MLGQGFVVIIDQIDQCSSKIEPHFRIDYDLEWRRGRISFRQTSRFGSAWLRPVAYITPLWHGVALCRSLSLGTATLGGALIHVGYLVGLTAIGVTAGNRSYRRRLYV